MSVENLQVETSGTCAVVVEHGIVLDVLMYLLEATRVIFTDRKGKVMFSQVSVCPRSASWLLVHCSALRRGRYASYSNAFLSVWVFMQYR